MDNTVDSQPATVISARCGQALYGRMTALVLLGLMFLPVVPSLAAPGDTLFSDNFERNSLGGNWSTTSSSRSGIGSHTSNSGTRSLYTRWDSVDVTSRNIDLSGVSAADLSMWIRIGDDVNANFSEWPDAAGEDLLIQYQDSFSNWITLETFIGGDHTAGAAYSRTYSLPPGALHSSFRIRIAQNGGSGNDYDYYHIDDVTVTEAVPQPALSYPFCDDFESGMGNWNTLSLGGDAGIGSQTYNSANNSLYLRWDEVAVESRDIDASGVSNPQLSLWVRRGDDAFSEDPDNNEDLRIEYYNSSGSWTTLQTLPGGGTDGESLNLNYALPTDAAHAGLKLRFYMEQGSGSDFDYWHIDDVCLGEPASDSLVAYYAQDESAWDGTSGEVTDNSGNGHDATAINGTDTDNTDPAMPGSPGTCRYGLFDGDDDYIELPASFPNLQDSFTISGWIRADNLGGDQRIFADDSNNNNGFAFSLNDGGNGRLRFFSRNVNPLSLDTGVVVQQGTWHFVAAVHDASTKTRKIYVDGNLEASDTYTGSWGVDNGVASIGGELDGTSEGVARWRFEGGIDELRIHESALSLSDLNTLMGYSHPCPVSPVAVYHLDEASWGAVLDSTGNGNDGSTSGTVTPASINPVVVGSPGTCGYAEIPDNNSTSTRDAIDTGIDVDSDIGNRGTISFWYKSNEQWHGNKGNRQLFDASGGSKYFHLTLLSQGGGNNGVLQFGLEDSSDDDFRIETGNNNVAADTWAHIAVTWDMNADEVNIYLNGNLAASSNINSNGTLGDMDTLFIGDNRSSYLPNDSTQNSANGSFDEIRIYDIVQDQGQIVADMNETHLCTGSSIDHLRILHDGSALTCQPETITIQACQNTDCTTEYTGDVTVSLSPTGWVGGDTVTFNGGQVDLELRHTTAETINLGISSATPNPSSSEKCFLSGVEGNCNITYHDSGFAFDVPPLTACTTSAPVTISAVRKDDTSQQCVPAFSNRTEDINFWSTYSNPSSGSRTVSVNGTSVATSSPGTGIPLTFDANGQSTVTVNYDDAGLMQLAASFSGSGDESGLVMTGNDSFVSVPAKFLVYSDDTNAACPSGDATCSVFKKAGDGSEGSADSFNLSVRAACSDDTVTPNFIHNGITIGHNLIAPAGGSAGTLSVGSIDITDADNGEATVSQSVTEVGVYTFTASSGTQYLGENPPVGLSENVGRFVPDRLAIAANTPVFADSCTGFTYQDQPFNYAVGAAPQLTITALNTAGNTTNNYGNTFWQLNSDLSTRNYTDQTGSSATLNINPDADNATLSGETNFDGQAQLTLDDGIGGDNFTYQRVSEEAPFVANIDLDFTASSLTDDDGVCYDSNNDSSCETYTISGISGTSLRFGQLVFNSAYGPEINDLTLPLIAQYYDGTDFIENSDDSCTFPPAPGDASYSNWDGNLVSPETSVSTISSPLAAGLGQVVMSAPGLGNDGNVDVTLSYGSIPWLRPDFDGDGTYENNPDDDPTANARFGMYRGDDRFLFWQESQ